MRVLILLFTLLSFLSSENYTFLVQPYSKEVELEAKIIAKIATASLHGKIKLFIPHMSAMEEEVYSKYFTISSTCETSNFVFVNKAVEKESLCDNANRLFFTNNYRKLLSDEKYFGALFWNKSRPNIVFSQKRLEKRAIILPKTFEQFIEVF
jgi:hypothetical protein